MKIGIIGGSGLYKLEDIEEKEEVEMKSYYGEPSSKITTGNIKGVEVAVLARHGKEHTIPPSQVNYRANITALKELGCTHILATSAVGSLREDIKRGDLVILDQFLDFTKKRKNTFYEEFEANKPVHTTMAKPFSKELRLALIDTCEELGFKNHKRGTVVTIEGPRFSTIAESKMFKSFGADVINMSIATEAALANEAEIPYGAVAMSTDYDCWREDEEPASWEEILKVFEKNAEKVQELLINTIPRIR
jgi:5'-methylthioadenosine phosphorylase